MQLNLDLNWVYCNKCFVHCDKKLQMFLTECQHIFCAKCINNDPWHEIGISSCLLCKFPGIIMVIDFDMPNEYKIFFNANLWANKFESPLLKQFQCAQLAFFKKQFIHISNKLKKKDKELATCQGQGKRVKNLEDNKNMENLQKIRRGVKRIYQSIKVVAGEKENN